MFPLMKAHATLVRASLSEVRFVARRGSPLPEEVRRSAEELLGEDLADVRVYRCVDPIRAGVVAFTSGSDIYFARGRYDPSSPEGLRLLGHELAHVVQQRRGHVRSAHGYGVAVVKGSRARSRGGADGARPADGAAAALAGGRGGSTRVPSGEPNGAGPRPIAGLVRGAADADGGHNQDHGSRPRHATAPRECCLRSKRAVEGALHPARSRAGIGDPDPCRHDPRRCDQGRPQSFARRRCAGPRPERRRRRRAQRGDVARGQAGSIRAAAEHGGFEGRPRPGAHRRARTKGTIEPSSP